MRRVNPYLGNNNNHHQNNNRNIRDLEGGEEENDDYSINDSGENNHLMDMANK